MAIISKGRLTEITEVKLGYKTFNDFLNESRREIRSYASTSVFLSHSHDDLEKDYIKKTIVFLRSLGIRVYIDSNDASMPPFTNAETAQKIKQAIKDNKKFIFLATNKAIESRWCNWELGFGDAFKYLESISLLPLSENSGSWLGSEYLKIYPRIEESNYTNEYHKVIYPDGKEVQLLEWLKL